MRQGLGAGALYEVVRGQPALMGNHLEEPLDRRRELRPQFTLCGLHAHEGLGGGGGRLPAALALPRDPIAHLHAARRLLEGEAALVGEHEASFCLWYGRRLAWRGTPPSRSRP